MDSQELDRELARIKNASVVDAEGSALLDELVMESRAAVPSRRRHRRRARIVWGVGGFVLAGALVAGVTYQDYLLTIPPFAGLMDGEQRTATGWVMSPEYGADAGEQCVLYPEFRKLSPAQFSAVSEFVLAEVKWDSLGAEATKVAEHLPDEFASDEVAVAYSNALSIVVHKRVQGEVLPGIPFRARFTVEDGVASDPPSFEGFTMSCLPGLADQQ